MASSSSSSSSFSVLLMLLFLLVLTTTTTLCSSSSIFSVVNGFGKEEGIKVGEKVEIKDVKMNKRVQELGKFSVEEFNKKCDENGLSKVGGGTGGEESLSFYEVVEAKRQVVSGLKYYLKISAEKGNGIEKKFDAVVLVKPWKQSKQLVNFSPSIN